MREGIVRMVMIVSSRGSLNEGKQRERQCEKINRNI